MHEDSTTNFHVSYGKNPTERRNQTKPDQLPNQNNRTVPSPQYNPLFHCYRNSKNNVSKTKRVGNFLNIILFLSYFNFLALTKEMQKKTSSLSLSN
jgi:hypothetical protein